MIYVIKDLDKTEDVKGLKDILALEAFQKWN